MISLTEILSTLTQAYFFLSSTFTFGGYEIPYCLALVFIAFIFFLSRAKRSTVRWRVKASKKWLVGFRANKDRYNVMQRFSYIRSVDHYLWEEIIMTCLEERGYSIHRTKYSRDGGSDGEFVFEKDYIVIQAKRYRGRISKKHVQDLHHLVLRSKKFKRGLFIHTGKSSEPILQYVRDSNNDLAMLSGVDQIIRFLDGEKIYLFGNPLKSIDT